MAPCDAMRTALLGPRASAVAWASFRVPYVKYGAHWTTVASGVLAVFPPSGLEKSKSCNNSHTA
eukprot:scaffold7453_cov177-Amphora_coffeaeformis.AAC.8